MAAAAAEPEAELVLEGMEEGELQEEAGVGSAQPHQDRLHDREVPLSGGFRYGGPVRTGHGLQITFANSRDLPVRGH